MNVIAGVLAVLFASQGPAPATTSGAAGCDVTDNRCKAERFERQAAQASSPSQRALYLHAAYRSYIGLYKETAEVRDLCTARRVFDQSLAVDGLSADQRTSFEEGRAELEMRERKANARCGRTVRRHVRAAAAPPRTASPAPKSATVVLVEPEAPAAGREEAGDLLPMTAGQTRSLPHPLVATAQPEAPPASPAPAPAPPRNGRPLVIAGGVTLGLGVSLAGVAGYTGSRALEVHRAGVQLHEDVQGQPDDDARARDAELEREYRRLGSMALGTALAGAAAVLVGTALVAVGGRRLARTASSSAFVPIPGGLAFHARF